MFSLLRLFELHRLVVGWRWMCRPVQGCIGKAVLVPGYLTQNAGHDTLAIWDNMLTSAIYVWNVTLQELQGCFQTAMQNEYLKDVTAVANMTRTEQGISTSSFCNYYNKVISSPLTNIEVFPGGYLCIYFKVVSKLTLISEITRTLKLSI